MDFDFFDSLSQFHSIGGEETLSGDFHTEPNIFGGENIFDHNNHQIGHTESNIFGGNNLIDNFGTMIGQSIPNIFGGFDIDILKSFNPGSDIPDFNL